MLQAALHEARPVADTVYERAAKDEVEWFRGERPVTLGICDCEGAVWWSGVWVWGGDVETEDVRVGMLGCEGDGPDAGTAADVDDALVRRGGYGSTVEAIVLNEPHAVLEVCRIGQLGPEESQYGRQVYPGGQPRPRDKVSCCHLCKREYQVVVMLLLTSPTGLARTYFCGSAMFSSYGSKTGFMIRFFDKENQLDFSTLVKA